MAMILPDPVLLRLIAHAIEAASREAAFEGRLSDDLPTAAALARRFNLRLEKTKKLLRTLRAAGLIQPQGLSPKRYWFDAYACRQLEADHPLYAIFFENGIWVDVPPE